MHFLEPEAVAVALQLCNKHVQVLCFQLSVYMYNAKVGTPAEGLYLPPVVLFTVVLITLVIIVDGSDKKYPTAVQVKAMVRAAAHGFLAQQEPQAPREGMGGTYFLLDDRGTPAGIFKPCDEEPLAPNLSLIHISEPTRPY